MVKTISDETKFYEIKVEGHLDAARAREFGNMHITLLANGQTLISGPVRDQAVLFGHLLRIRDMGINLVSVIRRRNKDVYQPHK